MEDISDRFLRIRRQTEALCAPLTIEDHVVQPHADVSPPKWHLAHTSWFFEQLILSQDLPHYRPFNQEYLFLFNSYYESFGKRTIRSERGFTSRPTVSEVLTYRQRVNEQMLELIATGKMSSASRQLLEVGLHHEQQHQELLCMDIKYILAGNPGNPCYTMLLDPSPVPPPRMMVELEGGMISIGQPPAGSGFAYDNETPQHQVYLSPFGIESHCVTNGEYLDFILDGGYQDFRHWLSDGWQTVQKEGWLAPLYWQEREQGWFEFGFDGWRPIDPHQPVVHVSYYEAQAFAKWSAKRLPTEFEWEKACQTWGTLYPGPLMEDRLWKPMSPSSQTSTDVTSHLLGGVWEWTQSAYLPYPGFCPAADALSEYNSKFMANQMVLRGGCFATPKDHIRPTYRNFFYPHQRWQFSGLRLARNI